MVSALLECCAEFVRGGLHQLARGRKIQTDEGAEALAAKPFAVVYSKTAAPLHKVCHLLRLHIRTKVYPLQIGSLKRRDDRLRRALLERIAQKMVIFKDLPSARRSPRRTAAIGDSTAI